MFFFCCIRQAHAQAVAAVFLRDGYTSLAAGSLILRPDDEELPRPGLGPCLFPFLVRLEAILLPMKLGMEESLRAEAQVYLAGLLVPFQSLPTLLQPRQAPPLVMQLLRTRQAFGQLAYDFLSLADFRL